MINTTDVATRFVDFIMMNHERLGESEKFSADEMQILFDIVSVAGFDPKEVALGKLVGHYRDQDGNTGETYQINNFCQFKVVSESGDHYFATGWLDCMFKMVAYRTRQKKDYDKLIEEVVAEIERSVPLTPIQLTLEGDFLCEYPPSPLMFGFEYFVDHTKDNHQISSCVGVHKYCNGWMDHVRATKTHDAIVCRTCHLRCLFSKEVKTYGDLRQALPRR